MGTFTAALADHVADHYGMVSDRQLRDLGVSVWQRRQLVEDRLLIGMHRGIYRARAVKLTFEGRCLAACLAVPDGAITGSAGGRLWGLRRMGTDPVIDMRVRFGTTSRADPTIRFRRCADLIAEDVVSRPDGIRLVSPPRLIFDLGAVLDDLDLESVIEQVLDREMCTIHSMRRVVERLARSSRPGSSRVVRVLASRPDWLKPMDSHLEVRLFDALRHGGVRDLVTQHRIELPGGWAIHADLAVPSLRWAIPIDHVTWHGGRINAQRDKQNDRQARMIGWQVDRVTDDDIEHRLGAVVGELIAIHDVLRRRPRLGRAGRP